ncbi:MAG: OmpA family protein [Bacteriovorax sp.]|nr:OmpA family protein [Bacteriovorax sp.]
MKVIQKKLTNKFFKLIFALLIIISFIACSSHPIVKELPPTAIPANEISNLEANLNMAKGKNVDLLSPKNFSEAQNYLEEAKEQFLTGKDSRKILHSLSVANTYLLNANQFADITRPQIQNIIKAREEAKLANAHIYFSKNFKNADEKLSDISKDIPKNKTSINLKKEEQLLTWYKSLEKKAVKERYLKEARDVMNQAKKEDAEKYAPRSLAIAEKSFSEAESLINTNPNNKSEIAAIATKARDDAYHAFNINRSAKGTAQISHEEIAILIEDQRQRVAGNEQNLNLVQDELLTTSSALEKEKEEKNSVILTKEELLAEKNKLISEKIMNEKYEQAREKFSENEAEVYRQGDSLIIRLKAMAFPSATSTIVSKNYPLLSKVGKIVEEFGPGTEVTILGHTDSVGSSKINYKLSSLRAQSVKDYLASITEVKEMKIEALGYGDQKPLATNKTPDGRAKNRRVDIIIKPSPSTTL